MFYDLRINQQLTRSELATILKKTPNYILKAEQLCFPEAPPSLVNYYSKQTGTNPDILKSHYLQAQHLKRVEAVLDLPQEVQEGQTPINYQFTDYQISKLFCIPASHIHTYRNTGRLSKYLLSVGDELVNTPELYNHPFIERLDSCLKSYININNQKN